MEIEWKGSEGVASGGEVARKPVDEATRLQRRQLLRRDDVLDRNGGLKSLRRRVMGCDLLARPDSRLTV